MSNQTKQATPMCMCGAPWTLRTVHLADNPCFVYEPVALSSATPAGEGLTWEDLNLEPSPLIEGWRVEYHEQGRNGPGVYAYYKDMHDGEDCHFLLSVPLAASPVPLSDTGAQETKCHLCGGRGFYGTPGARCEWCKGTGLVVPTPALSPPPPQSTGAQEVQSDARAKFETWVNRETNWSLARTQPGDEWGDYTHERTQSAWLAVCALASPPPQSAPQDAQPVAQVVAVDPPGPDGHGVNWFKGKRPKPGDLLYAVQATDEFKNFHRLLCERFGYMHDERDWKRDQLSLIEHIANLAKSPQASQSAPGEAVAYEVTNAKLRYWTVTKEMTVAFGIEAEHRAAGYPQTVVRQLVYATTHSAPVAGMKESK